MYKIHGDRVGDKFCRLCGVEEETSNHIARVCQVLAPERADIMWNEDVVEVYGNTEAVEPSVIPGWDVEDILQYISIEHIGSLLVPRGVHQEMDHSV